MLAVEVADSGGGSFHNGDLSFTSNMAKQIQSKCADGDIRSALRILTSDDTFSQPSKETVNILRSKHPQMFKLSLLPNFRQISLQLFR